jgi:mono/diheme cytochrome c family protein
MKTFLKIAGFSLLIIAFFAGFSNFGVPRIEPAPPPVEEQIDLGQMTMEKFMALGEKIFNGKGTCTLCHNALGGRAPMLDKVAVVAAQRIKDPGYKGAAKDAAGYLLESMIEPSAHVVAGFGKKGTGGKQSPMPDVSKGSIGLSDPEIKATMAYLQDRAGVEVTVEIPSDAAPAEQEDAEPRRPPFKTALEAVSELSCGACHKIGEDEGDAGPDLTRIGATRRKAQLRRSILFPNAEIAPGYEPDLMPKDYGVQLYAQELEMIVDYLAARK